MRWKGQISARGLSAGVGATWMEFTLTSECVDGKQMMITVQAVGPSAGVGIIGSDTKSTIVFEDHKDTIQPNSFNGLFGSVGAAIVIGSLDFSVGKIRLGDTFSRDSYDLRGLDFGIGLTLGSSTVTNQKTIDCSCK